MSSCSITSEDVLHALSRGAFPMARGREGQVEWFTADPRTVLPLDGRFKVRKSLAKVIAKQPFVVTRDRAFREVISACAQPRPADDQTWISDDIVRVYSELADQGYGHSVEAWVPRDDGGGMELVGGLYGLAIGGAFFGESMFSRRPYASQVCLVHLVEHLRNHGYTLCDVQFSNPHLEQFAAVEMRAEDYMRELGDALGQPERWSAAF